MPRNECPDQRGLRLNLGRGERNSVDNPERMPRSEGIETSFVNIFSISWTAPERMPRSEGIETLRVFGSLLLSS